MMMKKKKKSLKENEESKRFELVLARKER